MNNKPVAWATQDGVIAFHKKPEVDSQGFKWFPLYTHPVKELTDEEIEKIVKDNDFYWNEYGGFVDSKELLKVARAILRKAQEK
jgi:hypothetical protein